MNNLFTKPIKTEYKIRKERIYQINHKHISGKNIVYLIEREFHLSNNDGLLFAKELSMKYKLPVKVIYNIKIHKDDSLNRFINSEIFYLEKIEAVKNKDIINYLNSINTAVLIVDYIPNRDTKNIFRSTNFKVYEVDGHNIIPERLLIHNGEIFTKENFWDIINKYINFFTDYPNEEYKNTSAIKAFEKFMTYLDSNSQCLFFKYLKYGFISMRKTVIDILKSNLPITIKQDLLYKIILHLEQEENFNILVQ